MSRIIDLTQTIEHGMRGVEIECAMQLERDGWNGSTYHLYSHAGTHMDAPYHFGMGTTIDQIPLECLMGDAWVVNCSDVEPCEKITTAHLGMADERIRPGDMILIRTDWGKYVGDPCYRNKLPRISKGLAIWFTERQISLLGVEQPAVADVNNLEEIREIHTILLEAGIVIVEGLINLDQITSRKVKFIALPLKVKGGDGSPVRALAIVDED